MVTIVCATFLRKLKWGELNLPLDLIYLTTSVLNTGSKIIVNTVFCAQGKIVFWISLMINHPKSGWVFSTNTRDFHENLILLKSYYYLHFLKATYLRSNLQKKISKSVHGLESYLIFCTRKKVGATPSQAHHIFMLLFFNHLISQLKRSVF